MSYSSLYAPRRTGTKQTEKLSEKQVKNWAGGYVFKIDPVDQVKRFLILGSDAPTYYASAKEMTLDNAKCIIALVGNDEKGLVVVNLIKEVSLSGRAPKNDPALFALAIAASHGTDKVRRAALDAIQDVCRTGTHLFHFAAYVSGLRGWGRGLRTAIAKWYESRPVDELAYQMVKYQQRDGWTHGDLISLSRPKSDGEPREALFAWATQKHAGKRKEINWERMPNVVHGLDAAKTADTIMVPNLIHQTGIPREAIPTEHLNSKDVWLALLDKGMPMTALIRNLPTMTRLGLFDDRKTLARILARIVDSEALRKARVHPLNALVALRTYASGRSFRGSNEWKPEGAIVDALDEAFYMTFDEFQPTGKEIVVALDVSGSMGCDLSGYPISAREGAAAMAMTVLRTEKLAHVIGFTSDGSDEFSSNYNGVSRLRLSPKMYLDQVVSYTGELGFGSTDCALPMLWAIDKGVAADAFLIITDNETWSGEVHPVEALKRHRQKFGKNSKLVVMAMTSTGFTIADPADGYSMDVVGFDTAVPDLVSNFIRE